MIRTNTSASNFHRRVGCLASKRIEEPLPEPPSTRDADKGTELHNLWADPSLSRVHLDDKDLESLEAVEKMTAEFDVSFGITSGAVYPGWEMSYRLFRDTRHAMDNHPDRVQTWVEDRPINLVHVGILDAKFGRIEVDAAEDNWQLGVYAVSFLEHLETKFEGHKIDADFTMAILQPWASRQVKPVRMTIDAVRALREQIWAICEAGLSPNAAFNPTPSNCRYCKGALHGVCPANRDFALAPVRDSRVEAAFRDPDEYLASLHGEKRTQLLDALSMAEKLGKIIRPAARRLLRKDRTAIPGYSVKPDGETRSISDPNEFAHKLGTADISAVLRACSLSIASATKLFKAKTGLKGKELEERVKKFLDPLCDKTPREGNLERE